MNKERMDNLILASRVRDNLAKSRASVAPQSLAVAVAPEAHIEQAVPASLELAPARYGPPALYQTSAHRRHPNRCRKR